ncbi:MAG: hypothetical protein D8M58_10905 [Calditrichaeota bacterium]|nr:MAG: hypothetical protein DWQ03_10280 [Calditrichota bacterium]MBL1205901.1 hypothetical protein [Calditrichota bacterium]NOG45729.1 hypothetical protein [Calditrichota bacterium]
MELYKKIPWDYQGKKYEIRIMYQANIINIVSFLDNYPANGFRYQVLLKKDHDIKSILKAEKLNSLINNAKDDIKENRWGKFVA